MVPKLTNNGISMMIRAMAGEWITFTKIVMGNGEAPTDFTELTTLQNEMVSMEISEIVTEEQYVILKASMTNAAFETGFFWTELGVYAKNPDGGEDVLYAYAHYTITGDEAATFIPAFDSRLVEITHRVHVFVGTLENVTAVLTKHSEFASAEALDDHVKNTDNPHKVTKEHVGLGLVVNAKIEDQKPEFSNAIGGYILNDETGQYSFSNIFSGEKVGSMLQKIRTIISLTINHFNASNPHKMTAKKTGAAPEDHKSASTTYGMANETYFGHAKITDDETSESGAKDGCAASPTFVRKFFKAAKYAGSNSSGGAALSADKLTNAREIKVDLGSEAGQKFDGSENATLGVSGVLSVKHGGTGASNGSTGLKNLLKDGYMVASGYQIVASVEDIPADAPVNAIFFVPED